MFRRECLRQSRHIHSRVQSRCLSQSLSQPRSSISPFLSRTTTALPPRLPRRWVTTEAEQRTEGDRDAQAAPPEAPKEGSQETENPLQKELEAKNREIIDLKDKYLRSVAEFRNLQDRTKRDIESARSFAIQRFATDLIESIDNLDRALEAVPSESLKPTSGDIAESANKDLINLHSGLKMSESILMNTLKKHGLERFDPMDGEGRKFDPKVDEAVFMSPLQGKENGDVMMTQSKGFTLNGRILRAAKVGVVQNP